MWKITNVTPLKKDVADAKNWRKTGVGNKEADTYYSRAFADPYPFSKEFSMVSFGGEHKKLHHLYVLDHATGEIAPLYKTDASCFSPVSISPRPKPNTIPGDCPQEPGTGTFYVQDVYQGLAQQGVKRGMVKQLRIMSQIPKKYNTEGHRFHDHYPVVGQGNYYVKHNYGSVPVDDNGSAYFEAPSNTEIYFIALDENGKEVQKDGFGHADPQQAKWHPASVVTRDRLTPPKVSGNSMARMKRPPDKITPPSWGDGPVDYVKHVQPGAG